MTPSVQVQLQSIREQERLAAGRPLLHFICIYGLFAPLGADTDARAVTVMPNHLGRECVRFSEDQVMQPISYKSVTGSIQPYRAEEGGGRWTAREQGWRQGTEESGPHVQEASTEEQATGAPVSERAPIHESLCHKLMGLGQEAVDPRESCLCPGQACEDIASYNTTQRGARSGLNLHEDCGT